MSIKLIPYVILEANPDNKRPYVLPEFGIIQEDKLFQILLDKLVAFVYCKIDIETVNSIKDIEMFWEHYYDDNFMVNLPWNAVAVIDGIWKNVIPTDEDLYKAIIKEKNKCYISSDDESSVKTLESIIIEEDMEEE